MVEVVSAPERRHGTVDAPIGRHATAREKMSVARRAGARQAITHYDVEERFGAPPYASLLRFAGTSLRFTPPANSLSA